jgi:uncharacterized protein DUF922
MLTTLAIGACHRTSKAEIYSPMTTGRGHPSFAIFVLALTSAFVPPLYGRPSDSAAAWKEEIAAGYLPYRRLVCEDFPIDDRVHWENGIYTAGFFHYDYKFRCVTSKRRVVARVTEWVVRSGFDRNKSSRKSWFTSFERFLPHEQGHLDINEIHSRRLANTTLNKLPLGEGSTCKEAADDLKKKLDSLANRCSQEAQTEQNKYDQETARGRDELKQKEATADLEARLKKTAVGYGNS